MLPGNAEGPGTPAGRKVDVSLDTCVQWKDLSEGPLGPVDPVAPTGPVGPVLPARRTHIISCVSTTWVRCETYPKVHLVQSFP